MTDYYHRRFREYYEKTVDVDPESFLGPLAKKLEKGARILDVGCGSGRDLLWFKKRGFQVAGLERSPGLAELAAKKAGCEVIQGDFETCDFSAFRVDALVLVGALVHVPHEKLRGLLSRLLEAVRPDGHVLLSLKRGKGKQDSPDGRIFYLWENSELSKIFEKQKLKVSEYFVQVSSIADDDVWLGYVLDKKMR